MDALFAENADNITILAKYFLPSFAMTVVLLGAYALYKWKIKADQHEIEELNPERMQLRMQALAVDKIAQRKNEGETGKDAGQITTETDTADNESGSATINLQ